jgi:uncharacterized membrane protein
MPGLELIHARYENALEAKRAFDDLYKLDEHIIDMAMISKLEDGSVKINDRDDLEPREGRRLGLIIGSAMGLVAGPAGLLGALAGAAIGGAAGSLVASIVAGQVDSGITDATLKELVKAMPPSTSAILVAVKDEYVDEALAVVDAYKAEVDRYDVDVQVKQKIKHYDADEQKKR